MYILTDEDMDAVGDPFNTLSGAQTAAQKYANENDSAVTIWREYETVEPEEIEEKDEEDEESDDEEPVSETGEKE